MIMKAAVLHGKEDLRIEERPVPSIDDNQVLVKIEKVGICGSDVHYYKEGRIGSFVVDRPMILGHECSGIVKSVGKEVSNINPGDRVAIEPGVPCMKCSHCKAGRYNLCQNIFFFATPPDDGSLCEYVAFHADYVFKLPDTVSLEEGALIEPLAVGLFAIHRAQQQFGDTVVILGAGTIGLMTLQAAKAAGAGFITIIDIDNHKLELAKKFGANLVINSNRENINSVLETNKIENSIDVVYDAVGIGVTAVQSIELVRIGGKVIWLGLSNEEKPFSFGKVAIKEIEIRGMFRYSNMYPPAIKALTQGLFNLEDLITRRITLDEVPAVIHEISSGNAKDIKVVVEL